MPSFEEKDKGDLLMKGILYTILTATIGVLVGYVMSHIMRTPQESTMQALKNLATESQATLSSSKIPAATADKKDGVSTAPAAGNSAPPNESPKGSPSTAPEAAPAAPLLPPAPGDQKPADKPKDAAPAAAPSPTPAAPAPAAATPAPAKKPPVPQGPVFLKGTNPYGPPPLVEQDIFTPSTLLKVEYDPSASTPDEPYVPKTIKTPTFNQLLQEPPPSIYEEPAPEPLFQVQFGAFSTQLNAIKFANRLQEKGYAVNIYEGPGRNRGAWYFVRMDKMMDQTIALETAKNIHSRENFSPMVIQPADTDKKLR